MTTEQKNELKKLNRILSRKGLTIKEWSQLIELRTLSLIEKGQNPDHYELESFYCQRKSIYK